ncbi:PA14 domain-containing protein [Chitinophaga sp. Cy-1792]|uniref:PA14 domain-containing protein n=1 Tax=Chitinophaga sp. Cy-1792 TaxID=2608339 RepID=UPI00141F1262|nr:PA14 domain-containing protein [Chitinophaga sp. Cy-1792]NIG52801.1 hypothetical protein [Chitinophaga sp. Cy-1792]
MILALCEKGKKTIAYTMLALIYFEAVIPQFALGAVSRPPVVRLHAAPAGNTDSKKNNIAPVPVPSPAAAVAKVEDKVAETAVEKTESASAFGGPTQPETQAFTSVNGDNMVDLFTGDFSYSIPLIDVGGYPVALGYNSGVSMDQEASWTGLGWNINPGTVTRNMRGLPDDFNGLDSVTKTMSIKDNKTIGVTAAADAEFVGVPFGVGAQLGIFHNTYRGWGLETGINASINVGEKASGPLSGGLSVTNNSQEGLTISPTLSYSFLEKAVSENGSMSGSLTIGTGYNSRGGMKALQFSGGVRLSKREEVKATESKKQASKSYGTQKNLFSGGISFVYPSFTPTISVPYTSTSYALSIKGGLAYKFVHPNFSLSGYVSNQFIADEDTTAIRAAYGYLNYQNANGNAEALLDYNREKEMPYRAKPKPSNIAIPSYTYDVFNISGEGTGGMFRAFRSDIGYVYDHHMRTRDNALSGGIDLGTGDLAHMGADINYTHAFTESGPWLAANPLAELFAFRKSNKDFEASYFKNPAEISTGDWDNFYSGLNFLDIWEPQIDNSNDIAGTSSSMAYIPDKWYSHRYWEMTPDNVVRRTRDKRSQVISYLTAKEAALAGQVKYIDNYQLNRYRISNCDDVTDDTQIPGTGFKGEYFKGINFNEKLFERIDSNITFSNPTSFKVITAGSTQLNEVFSVRWTGRIKATVSGKYTIRTASDDGVRLWVNDSLFIDDWRIHGTNVTQNYVYLEAGQVYRVRVDFYQNKGDANLNVKFTSPEGDLWSHNFYPPEKESFQASDVLTKEKRVNGFRKANHISEIDVLNPDGRKYTYGIPVYNFNQKDVTFSVDHAKGNEAEGLVDYTPGIDNTTRNSQGNDHYFNKDEMPAYAHSFLLTGITSPDYVDVTGNGISDDDLGEAVRFNYSKVAGKEKPYQWRTPYSDSASLNPGMRTDDRDDKGSYVYGEKELWYLNSIESKNMIATFKVSNREDLLAIDENGHKIQNHLAKKLDEINLYTKADFLKYDTLATPVKTVHFEYAYDLCRGVNGAVNDSGKLTLKKVWFTYNGNKKGQRNPYVFNYNARNPTFNPKSNDRWGTYKDPGQNPGAAADKLVTNADYPYALQDSSVAAANVAAWTLDSIHLPSGGRIKVNYESDDYAYVQNKIAAQMVRLVGFSATMPTSMQGVVNSMYNTKEDFRYVVVRTPWEINDDNAFSVIPDNKQLYFRLFVNMPSDKWGSGGEYVPCYATATGKTQVIGKNLVAIEITGIKADGTLNGPYSPLVMTAIQFLRLNLPSKAYPGSDVGDDLSLSDMVKIVFSQATNIKDAFRRFDAIARDNKWARDIDTLHSLVRINNVTGKKYGGGVRVKSVLIYDHWNQMTGQKESVYGNEYKYTTFLNDDPNIEISSGVAAYEPALGGEENPFHNPIPFFEKAALFAPTNMGYTEEPLGEGFFPGATVGYRKVQIRSIHGAGKKSAAGFTEKCFYTSYEYPTIVTRTPLKEYSYQPKIANFLKVNAKHYLTLSQGFDVELNDMTGKVRSEAIYGEEDDRTPITITTTNYKSDYFEGKSLKLNNYADVADRQGGIRGNAVLGVDVELMTDMREQISITSSSNLNVNGVLFTFFIPPVLALPFIIPMGQHETNMFHSYAATKVINRHGIVSNIVTVDKGSKVVTSNVIFDAETGAPIVTKIENEFEDPIFSTSYPASWAYDGMSGAYQNIGVVADGVTFRDGRLTEGLTQAEVVKLFSAGDEVLVYSRNAIDQNGCTPQLASFPGNAILTVLDTAQYTTPSQFFFMTKDGRPFTGYDVSLKIVRSGRRNIQETIGTVVSMEDPHNWAGNLIPDSTSNVINASAAQYGQFWKVRDSRRGAPGTVCVATKYQDCTTTGTSSLLKTQGASLKVAAPAIAETVDSIARMVHTANGPKIVMSALSTSTAKAAAAQPQSLAAQSTSGISCTCSCIKPLFDYLLNQKRLFMRRSDNMTVQQVVNAANAAGYSVSISDCPLLAKNANKLFYALTTNPVDTIYKAQIGDCLLSIRSTTGKAIPFANMKSGTCDATTGLNFSAESDPVSLSLTPTSGMNVYFRDDVSTDAWADWNPTKIKGSWGIPLTYQSNPATIMTSVVKFGGISVINPTAVILDAKVTFSAAAEGFNPPAITNAHTLSDDNPYGDVVFVGLPTKAWTTSSDLNMFRDVTTPWTHPQISSPFQNLQISAKPFVEAWLRKPAGNVGMIMTSYNDGGSSYFAFNGLNISTETNKPKLDVTYKDTMSARLVVDSCVTCEVLPTASCYSAITDTSVNPYTYNVAGVWRPMKGFVYMGSRTPAAIRTPVNTNIREDGTIQSFVPFWTRNSDKLLVPQYDTMKWRWAEEKTLYNSHGYELETRNPLGIYSSMNYGFDYSLPVSVSQNAQYRETGNEGFEDYDFEVASCDAGACKVPRNFDFSGYKNLFSTAESHTGRYSIKIPGGGSAGITANVTSGNAAGFGLIANMQTDACTTMPTLKSMRVNNNVLLPAFAPTVGKRQLVSGWVKEGQTCNCTTYEHSRVVVVIATQSGNVTVTARPSGPIIEGWQRFEQIVDIPLNATAITFSMEATDSNVPVYFDDIRLHPYNANMKSFIYSPMNLRLIAELDANNFATFYEYDDDGVLIRVKKETERGIKTIKESRDGLLKED